MNQEIYETETIGYIQISDGSSHLLYSENPWENIWNYCQEKTCYITKFIMGFRSHKETIFESSDEDGFFFVKSVLANFGDTRSHQRYIVGKVYNTNIICQKWGSPEIQLIEEEEKNITDYKPICFVWKKNIQIEPEIK